MTAIEIIFKYKTYEQTSGYVVILICDEYNTHIKLKRNANHSGTSHYPGAICDICGKYAPLLCAI